MSFVEELLLQRFGGGGNHNAPSAANCGNQVGERFAGAGAGFDDGVLLFGERFFEELRHFELRWAVLVALRHALFEHSARTEYFLDGGLAGFRWRSFFQNSSGALVHLLAEFFVAQFTVIAQVRR